MEWKSMEWKLYTYIKSTLPTLADILMLCLDLAEIYLSDLWYQI